MAGSKVENLVSAIVETIVKDLEFELVKVSFTKEGGKRYLRIFLDREGGINLAHCQTVAETLSRHLDEANPIPESYFLEVSSAGLERPLNLERDYYRFAGRDAEVRTRDSSGGRRRFRGRLGGLEGEKLLLQREDGETLRIPLAQIANAHLLDDGKGGSSPRARGSAQVADGGKRKGRKP